MNNIKVFSNFWNGYTNTFREIWDRDLDDENLENLIDETKDIFVKNTVQITGEEFTSIDLAEIAKLVEDFFKS